MGDFSCLPNESTILRFRNRLEKHELTEQILSTVYELLSQHGLLQKTSTVVDATLIAALTSTENKDKSRDPEVHSSKKGNQWYFGMKAHIGADAESGLLHTVRGTSGRVSDISKAHNLLHGQETLGFGDAGYHGVDKSPDAKADVTWYVEMTNGKRRALDKANEAEEAEAIIDRADKLKAIVRARVEHPFRVIKRQFEFVKVRYRGVKKNMAQLFALSNLWMVCSKLMGAGAEAQTRPLK